MAIRSWRWAPANCRPRPDTNGDTITIINTAANLKFVFEGVGLTLTATPAQPTSPAAPLPRSMSSRSTERCALFDITGSVDAATWYDAIVAAAAGNNSLIETLTSGWSFNFVGGAGPDAWSAGDLNDFFRSSGGNDLFDGQFGYDRANYTHAPGAINVQLADGTVTKFTDGTGLSLAAPTRCGRSSSSPAPILPTSLMPGHRDYPQGFNSNSTNAGSTVTFNVNGTFNEFEGRGGNDIITGNGSTRISYLHATAGVTVDFRRSWIRRWQARRASADGDDLRSGTTRSPASTACAARISTTFCTAATIRSGTFENFEGRGGNDYIDGRGGFDRAVYANEDTGIVVNLAAGTVTGGPIPGSIRCARSRPSPARNSPIPITRPDSRRAASWQPEHEFRQWLVTGGVQQRLQRIRGPRRQRHHHRQRQHARRVLQRDGGCDGDLGRERVRHVVWHRA